MVPALLWKPNEPHLLHPECSHQWSCILYAVRAGAKGSSDISLSMSTDENKKRTQMSIGILRFRGRSSYRGLMPEQPPRSRHLIWTLSQAHGVQQIVRVRCGHCPGKRHYLPCDLQQLLGDVDVQRLSRLMRCEQCGKGDEIEAHVFIPVAAERVRLKVRRLVEIKIRRVPVWRDE